MKKLFFRMLSFFTSAYDVPADATWSQQSIAVQKVVQNTALQEQLRKEELDALVADSKDFISDRGFTVQGHAPDVAS